MSNLAPSFDKVTDERLADWVELELDRQRSSPENSEATEKWLSDPTNWLRSAERRALLSAFENRGKDRWRPVVDLLKVGSPSARMAEVLAKLIEHGAFTSQAKLTKAENAVSDDREIMLWNRGLIRRLLLEAYSAEDDVKVRRRATKVAAILLGRKATTVSKAVHAVKDAPRRPLADLRLAVEQGPCLPDE